jgi:hypothetical protein
MVEVLTVDAASTIQLLESIEALFSMLAPVHVFLDNALSSPPGSHSVGRAGMARPARVPDQAAHELAE